MIRVSKLPSIKFFNQDITDLYSRIWLNVKKHYVFKDSGPISGYYDDAEKDFNLTNAGLMSLFLMYSNGMYPGTYLLDLFYSKQETDGKIWPYIKKDTLESNKEKGFAPGLPILAYTERMLYERCGDKKRLKIAAQKLDKYYEYVRNTFLDPQTGLYPISNTESIESDFDRKGASYATDWNILAALNELELLQIATIINDKDMQFRHKRNYFALKSTINSRMWNEKTKMYNDLDADGEQIEGNPYLGFALAPLAGICEREERQAIIDHLKNREEFFTFTPFPMISKKNSQYSSAGNQGTSGVSGIYNFFVIKGLEKSGEKQFATECTLKFLSSATEGILAPEGQAPSAFWEFYSPEYLGPSKAKDGKTLPKQSIIPTALTVINLMIETVLGFDISFPHKQVVWNMQEMRTLGIQDFLLKKNYISLFSNPNKKNREIDLKSEKLYYFHLFIRSSGIDKQIPIPSGSCVLLPDKFDTGEQ